MLDDSDGEVTRGEMHEAILRHFDGLISIVGEKSALLNMRTILPWYGRRDSGIKTLMPILFECATANEFRETIGKFFQEA